ncbi:uncharacterized protein [Periplaneta americana]|uniref:uncharacterized protein isoform X4 n=1 Tax=Periplaneta americana TaxID=6978 RepID=UPI0037E7891D
MVKMEVIKVEPLAVDGLQTQSSIFGEVANESKSHNEFKEEEEEEEEEEEVKVKEEEAAAVPFIFVAVNTETEGCVALSTEHFKQCKRERSEICRRKVTRRDEACKFFQRRQECPEM